MNETSQINSGEKWAILAKKKNKTKQITSQHFSPNILKFKLKMFRVLLFISFYHKHLINFSHLYYIIHFQFFNFISFYLISYQVIFWLFSIHFTISIHFTFHFTRIKYKIKLIISRVKCQPCKINREQNKLVHEEPISIFHRSMVHVIPK